MKRTQLQAHRAGQVAEDVLAAFLTCIGVTFDRQAVIGLSIYGTRLHADFVVRNLVAFPHGLVVESKWQDGDGTVDEKFPYLYENIRAGSLPTVVIVQGGGCRPGALDWLRSRVDGERLVSVLRLEEFMSWAHRSPKL
jgi:hypothetical protein